MGDRGFARVETGTQKWNVLLVERGDFKTGDVRRHGAEGRGRLQRGGVHRPGRLGDGERPDGCRSGLEIQMRGAMDVQIAWRPLRSAICSSILTIWMLPRVSRKRA